MKIFENGKIRKAKASEVKLFQIPDAYDGLSYAGVVSMLIREKYSLDDEIAINRQRDTKPQEFSEYFEFCEECKNKARLYKEKEGDNGSV